MRKERLIGMRNQNDKLALRNFLQKFGNYSAVILSEAKDLNDLFMFNIVS